MTNRGDGSILGQVTIDVPTRRERKKSATHRSLLDAALDLFAEQGFAETTIEDIAARADVAPRTFFRYFPNKAAVLQPATDDYLERFGSILDDAPVDDTPLATLQRAVRETLGEFHEDRERILLQKQISVEAHIDLGADEFARLWAAFEALIAQRFDLDAETDPAPSLYTGIAIGIVSGAVRAWLADDARGDLRELVDVGFDALHGLEA